MKTRFAMVFTAIGLLAILAGIAMYHTEKARASSGVQYLVLDMPQPLSSEKLQEILNKRGLDNWELVATPRGHSGTNKEDGFLIFRRE